MRLTAEEKQLEKQVRKEAPGLLDGLSGEKKAQLLKVLGAQVPISEPGMMVTQTQVTTTSPVPPAELLIGYNGAFPDGANRLFTLVESQTQHRQKLETIAVNKQLELSQRGQTFAFIVTMTLIVAGVGLTLMGYGVVGGTIFSVTVTALATVFIVGQHSQKRNLDQKAP